MLPLGSGTVLGESYAGAGVTYQAARCAKARKLCTSKNKFAVMSGGSISPAAYSVMKGEPLPNTCPWCQGSHVPTAEHVAWNCTGLNAIRQQHRVADLELRCPLQKRLGWPSLMPYDELVLDWLCLVRLRFLDERYVR